MNIGFIKWFDIEKGFGVISTLDRVDEIAEGDTVNSKDSNEVFLHIKNWSDPAKIDLSNIIPVVFETAFERNKITAKECRYFSNSKENWSILFSYMGETESIRINERHSSKEYNLITYALKSLADNFSESILSESLEEYIKLIPQSNILEQIHTLLKVRKETGNAKLKNILDEVFTRYLQGVESKSKFNLWKKGRIPISCISRDDLLENSLEISIKDLKLIKEQYGNEESIHPLVIQILQSLNNIFDLQVFISFDEIISLIEDEIFKIKVIKDLNVVAKSHFIKSFYTEIEKLGKIENSRDIDKLKMKLMDIPGFINPELLNEIKKSIEYNIIENASIEGIFKACLAKIFSDPESILIKKQNDLTENILTGIVDSEEIFSDNFINKLLENLSENASKHELVYEIASQIGNDEFYKKLDSKIYNQLEEKEYFTFWTKGKGKIIPKEYLVEYFDDVEEKYTKVEKWINQGYLTTENLNTFLDQKLRKLSRVEDRKEFHTVFNIIQFFVKKNSDYSVEIQKSKNDFQLLVLWYLGYVEHFDYELLKGKFIYFKPNQQVRIVKKLFLYKKQGIFDFTIEKLDELVKADLDLFLTNEKFNPEIILDLSTSIVIEGIKKFKKEGKFIVESELLSIVLREIGNNKTKKFKLGDYFDKCGGRMIGDYNWKTNGEIKKVPFGENLFYYAISFQTGTKKWQYNRYGGYEEFIPNSKFEESKEGVKKITGRKWNPEKSHWGVPSIYESEVLQFAKEFKFFLNFEGSHYANNNHLVEFKRDEIPNGIKFCEGQNSQKLHNTIKKNFWWCANQPCFENVAVLHDVENWENYTILDFINILGLSAIETGNYGTFDIGLYNQFISQLNRFNQLLDKIYCKECSQILYPVESSNYAAYSVVRFCCKNEKCVEYNSEIYLNHCLNGNCNAIIDSRDSKKCPHGLFICQNCGTCCSHAMFTRRLNNLENTGGLIHSDLRLKVKNNEGHLERAEYYCHSCGNMMTEISADTFKCYSCNVTYETGKYKFERKFKSLRRPDYPVEKTYDELDK